MLLDEVLSVYGGLERWRESNTIEVRQRLGGILWSLKDVDGILDESTVKVWLQQQQAWHRLLPAPGRRSMFTPQMVLIETDEATRKS